MANYRLIDFVNKAEIFVHPKHRNHTSINSVKRIIKELKNDTFSVDGVIKSIVVVGAKEALPTHSFINAFFLAQSIQEVNVSDTYPAYVGSLDIGCGGSSPDFIKVKWYTKESIDNTVTAMKAAGVQGNVLKGRCIE